MRRHQLIVLAVFVPFLFLKCSRAAAADISANQSGPWNVSSTWYRGVIPGAGDTVTIPDSAVVTLTDARTVGTSGPNGTVVLRLNNSGQLVIANGGTLHVRGNTTANGAGGSPGPVQLTIQAGGAWEFDSSAAASPGTIHYTYGPTSAYQYLRVAFSGTASSRVTVSSNAGGGAGYFAANATNSTPSFVAAFTDFTRIGDASHDAFDVNFVDASKVWNVTNSTFTNSGAIANTGCCGVFPNATFIHDYNLHSASADVEVFHGFQTNNATTGTGTREIKGNIFDIPMSLGNFYPGGFAIAGNYFAGSTLLGGVNAWASWNDNFMRYSDYSGVNTLTATLGDLNNTYLFVDSDNGNPHMMGAANGTSCNINGAVFGQAGTTLGPPGPPDSGELYFLTSSLTPVTCGVYNSIMLPNMAGFGALEIGSMLPSYPNVHASVEHNTWFGGWNRGRTLGQAGFPAIMLGEGANGISGSVISFRSNILWNPQLAGYTSSFFKLADVSYSVSPTVDYCAPSGCDFNTGLGHTLTDTAHPQYRNQGKGYAAAFSSPPGRHDVDVDPVFIDWQRSVELYDSKYLGHTPAAWNSGGPYGVGDFVQHSRADVYWNLPVNYRYTNSRACSGTNPEPGAGTHWRDCWEWASLFRIREGIRTQQLLDDQVIGLHGEDAVTTVLKWVRAGYAPTNTALMGAGHDGFDIGATPVVFLPPSTNIGPAPITVPTPPTTIQFHGRSK